MNSFDIINYKQIGFDNKKYYDLQRQKIHERINHFSEGHLYLEIGGKFLYDPHASRVLPGFAPDVKKQLFLDFSQNMDIIFCVDAESISHNRQLNNTQESYQQVVFYMIENLHKQLHVKPFIAINLCDPSSNATVEHFKHTLEGKGYSIYSRYKIDGYPHNTKLVVSPNGYGKDEYIPVTKKLVLVTGAASNSGKLSTCLGQMYLDYQKGIKSGYAKYETFPVWNLELEHPVNLAYESATADIGDYNVLDYYYRQAYGGTAVNYNRDVEAFKILLKIGHEIVDAENFIRTYKSPTDMGINYAGFAITNNEIVSIASYNEIIRRKEWYREISSRGNGDVTWVRKCTSLEKTALEYIIKHEYNPHLVLE